MQRRTSCALWVLAAAMGSVPVHAQSAPAPSEASAAEAAPQSEIIVTGSRISRRDYSSTSPITTVDGDFIARSDSSTLETSLNQLPQIAASASSSTNTQARGGQASINLRGLGQQRTLVLLDGRRIQPSSPDGAVDLNIVPAALVGNVEIITGGASAIYGSDAVTGVVNLKLRRDLDGIEASAKFGVSERGDAGTRDFNLLGGTEFAGGRGSIIASFGYSRRDDAPFTDRPHLRGQVLVPAIPDTLVSVSAANLPSQAALDAIFAGYGAAPGTVSPTTQLSFNRDGTLFAPPGAVNYRGSLDLPYRLNNGTLNYAVSETYTAQTPLERITGFGHVDFELADSVTLFVEGLYTNYSVVTGGAYANAGSSSGRPLSVPVTNPFIPDDLRIYLASRPDPDAPFRVSRFTVEAGPREERNEYDVYQITAGLNGTIADGLSWSLVGSYGKTTQATTYRGYPSTVAMQDLLSAPDGGRSLCDGGYDLFGAQPVSDACVAYISRTAHNRTELGQTIVEGTLSGGLFDLPAGTLKFAAGAAYRENSYSFDADPLISNGELANFLPVFSSGGKTKALEGYVELLIPVLHDLPLIREFNLAPSYRYSDYNTVGGISTYKIDADWLVTEGVRVRGGYSRATRAPSAGELFAATNLGQAPIGSPGLIGLGDPCDVRGAYRASGSSIAGAVRDLCLAQGVPSNLIDSFTNINPRVPFEAGGNTGLAPEKADTYSVGVVLNPKFASPWLSRLSLSVDYYKIAIEEAIGQITNNVALSQCFDPTANPGLSTDNYYCALLTRDPTNGQLSQIGNPLLNLATYSSSGIDTQFDWRVDFGEIGLGGDGSFAIHSVVSYLDSFKIQNLAGAPTLEYAGTIGNQQIDLFATAHPRWKATTSGTLTLGGTSVALRWRFLDKMDNAANAGTGGTATGVKAVSYFDLDIGTKISDTFDLSIGAVNLFDKKPPILYTNPTGVLETEPYSYDLIGRRFYVSAKAVF